MTAATDRNDMTQGPWRPSKGVGKVKTVTYDDLKTALAKGWADFKAEPQYGVAFGLFYALGGIAIVWITWEKEYRGLMFPLVAGFTLIGPFAAVALYEVSRLREVGGPISWGHIGRIMRGASGKSIMMLGFVLMFALAVWSRVALIIYAIFFGLKGVEFGALITEIVTTTNGATFFLIGNGAGAFFAAATFAISVVSFPFLLDRDSDFITAMVTSVSVVRENMGPMIVWGLIVTALLVLATATFFLALIVVLPILGHATWHVYRASVEH